MTSCHEDDVITPQRIRRSKAAVQNPFNAYTTFGHYYKFYKLQRFNV